jgi:hypothetical protein
VHRDGCKNCSVECYVSQEELKLPRVTQLAASEVGGGAVLMYVLHRDPQSPLGFVGSVSR